MKRLRVKWEQAYFRIGGVPASADAVETFLRSVQITPYDDFVTAALLRKQKLYYLQATRRVEEEQHNKTAGTDLRIDTGNVSPRSPSSPTTGRKSSGAAAVDFDIAGDDSAEKRAGLGEESPRRRETQTQIARKRSVRMLVDSTEGHTAQLDRHGSFSSFRRKNSHMRKASIHQLRRQRNSTVTGNGGEQQPRGPQTVDDVPDDIPHVDGLVLDLNDVVELCEACAVRERESGDSSDDQLCCSLLWQLLGGEEDLRGEIPVSRVNRLLLSLQLIPIKLDKKRRVLVPDEAALSSPRQGARGSGLPLSPLATQQLNSGSASPSMMPSPSGPASPSGFGMSYTTAFERHGTMGSMRQGASFSRSKFSQDGGHHAEQKNDDVNPPNIIEPFSFASFSFDDEDEGGDQCSFMQLRTMFSTLFYEAALHVVAKKSDVQDEGGKRVVGLLTSNSKYRLLSGREAEERRLALLKGSTGGEGNEVDEKLLGEVMAEEQQMLEAGEVFSPETSGAVSYLVGRFMTVKRLMQRAYRNKHQDKFLRTTQFALAQQLKKKKQQQDDGAVDGSGGNPGGDGGAQSSSQPVDDIDEYIDLSGIGDIDGRAYDAVLQRVEDEDRGLRAQEQQRQRMEFSRRHSKDHVTSNRQKARHTKKKAPALQGIKQGGYHVPGLLPPITLTKNEAMEGGSNSDAAEISHRSRTRPSDAAEDNASGQMLSDRSHVASTTTALTSTRTAKSNKSNSYGAGQAGNSRVSHVVVGSLPPIMTPKMVQQQKELRRQLVALQKLRLQVEAEAQTD